MSNDFPPMPEVLRGYKGVDLSAYVCIAPNKNLIEIIDLHLIKIPKKKLSVFPFAYVRVNVSMCSYVCLSIHIIARVGERSYQCT